MSHFIENANHVYGKSNFEYVLPQIAKPRLKKTIKVQVLSNQIVQSIFNRYSLIEETNMQKSKEHILKQKFNEVKQQFLNYKMSHKKVRTEGDIIRKKQQLSLNQQLKQQQTKYKIYVERKYDPQIHIKMSSILETMQISLNKQKFKAVMSQKTKSNPNYDKVQYSQIDEICDEKIISNKKKQIQKTHIVQQMSHVTNVIKVIHLKFNININWMSEQERNESIFTFVLFFSLYFVQGLVISLSVIMPYVYPSLPSYQILALFQSSVYPFSFKFLIAPLLEKYHSIEYGKRKSSLVFGQLFTGVCIIIASFYTDLSQAKVMAVLLFIAFIFLVTQDISLDSLAIKELHSSERVSVIQSVAQSFGILVGSLLLLKLTSLEFAHSINLTTPIASPAVIVFCFGLAIICPAFLLHFLFKETTLQSQKNSSNMTLSTILHANKSFIQIQTTYCRMLIFFLIWQQGTNFFSSSYDYELIKRGFSRNTLNTISNINAIPILIITFFLARITIIWGLARSMFVALLINATIIMLLTIFFPLNPIIIGVTSFILSVGGAWCTINVCILINNLPVHSLSGMFITMLYSSFNFGNMVPLHTILVSKFGFQTCVFIGVIYQCIILCFIFRLLKWIQQGDTSLQFQNYSPAADKMIQLDQIP